MFRGEWGVWPISATAKDQYHSSAWFHAHLKLRLLRVFSRMFFLLRKPSGTVSIETLGSQKPLFAGDRAEGSLMQHILLC